jgi:hypothetical protein
MRQGILGEGIGEVEAMCVSLMTSLTCNRGQEFLGCRERQWRCIDGVWSRVWGMQADLRKSSSSPWLYDRIL